MKEQDRIRLIKEKAEEALFKIPGVHGVGIGPKHTRGKYTGELSIKVYVSKKKALEEIPSHEVIPAEIEGVKTDVVETGPPELCVEEDTRQYRPARGGTCIQLQDITRVVGGFQQTIGTGTLGCIARTTGSPSIIVGVTNHHVVALGGTLTKGKPVGQASPEEYSICSKCCSEIIGVVLDGIDNLAVDVALIKLNRKLEYYNQVQDEPNNFLITGTYSMQTSGIPHSPYHVKKRGERTRLTTGTIDAVSTNFTDQVTHTVTHTGVISIRPDSGLFADHGDSGSALVSAEGTDTGKMVGLLFAANTTSGYGFAFDIDVVKTQLSNIHLPIEILTASALSNKQTVPDSDDQANAYMVAAAQEESEIRLAADAQLLKQVQDDLMATGQGRHYIEVFQRHQEEVRTLINTNNRVAVAWHRNCGPSLIRKFIEVLRSTRAALPVEIEGRPFVDCVNRIIQAFARYGSAQLSGDLMLYGAPLARLGGQTYDQILGALRADVLEPGLHAPTEAGV